MQYSIAARLDGGEREFPNIAFERLHRNIIADEKAFESNGPPDHFRDDLLRETRRSIRVDGPGTCRMLMFSTKRADTMSMFSFPAGAPTPASSPNGTPNPSGPSVRESSVRCR